MDFNFDFLSQRRPLGQLIEDPDERKIRELTLADLAQQRDLHAFELDSKRRGQEDDEVLAKQWAAMSMAGMTPDAKRAAIAGAGRASTKLVKGLSDYEKTQSETAGHLATTKKTELEGKLKAFGNIGTVANEELNRKDGPDHLSLSKVNTVADLFGYKLEPFTGDPSDRAAVAQHLALVRNQALNLKDSLDAQQAQANAAETKDYHAQETKDRAAALAQGMTIAQLNDARQRENASATRDVASATRDAAKTQQVTTNISKVRDDYRVDSKGWAETSRSMAQINRALETATTSAPSALAAGTSFMKILDPTSVVRETELGMALNASGAFDRALNIVNKFQYGQIMSKQQVAALRAAANDFYTEAAATQRKIDARYAKLTTDLGGDPAHVVLDLGQNTVGQFKAKNGATVGPGQ